jgi:predicted DsbA family dithiol-disulfide isomerase
MQVHIWSDIACPFCHMNTARLSKALAESEHSALMADHDTLVPLAVGIEVPEQ